MTVKKKLTLSLTLWLCLVATIPAQAYDVEANSCAAVSRHGITGSH